MLTPQEALEKARRMSSPEHRARLEDAALAAVHMSIANTGEQPDVIIGGKWPSKTIGALRATCNECDRFLCLSPDSGAQMHSKYPDVPVLCFDCATKLSAEQEG